jgi:hypothetical protein
MQRAAIPLAPVAKGPFCTVSWLAQFVTQIVTAVKWEPEFRCQGIESLDDFKAVVEEINSVDPGQYSFHLPVATEWQGSFSVRGFATRIGRTLGAFGCHR